MTDCIKTRTVGLPPCPRCGMTYLSAWDQQPLHCTEPECGWTSEKTTLPGDTE